MTETSRVVVAGLEFIKAFDDVKLDERTAGLRELVADDATWWIGTGEDRLAGRRGHDPGADRPWPLQAGRRQQLSQEA